MALDASVDQVADVRAALEADDRVDDFFYMDKAAAGEEFRELFADSPDLAGSVDEAILPTSFRVTVEREADIDAFARDHNSADGVRSVETPSVALRPVLAAKWEHCPHDGD